MAVINLDSVSVSWYKTEGREFMDELDKLLQQARESGDYDFKEYEKTLWLYHHLFSFFSRKGQKNVFVGEGKYP